MRESKQLSRIRCALVVAGITAVFSPWIRADETGETTDEKIDTVDQRLRILERKRELEQENATEKAKETATVGAGKDGFFVKSADGAFQLKIRGYIQMDGRFFHDDTLKPGTDTFLLRRVRPIFEGTVWKIFDFRLMPDFGGGTTVLQDAYMDARFSPMATLRAGKFKPPVGLERLQSATDIVFVERALPTNLVPNRDIGLQLQGEFWGGVLSYAAGVFNGVADGGSADVDTNDSKEGAARVFLLPFKKTSFPPLQGFGIGVSGTQGNNKGALTATGLAGYKSASQNTFFSFRNDGTITGTVLADGQRTRLSPQAYYYAGRFGAIAEYVRSSQEVQIDVTEAKLESTAWQVTASFMLTADKASYKSVSPKKPFDLEANTAGAFELVARIEKLTVDEKAFPVFANPDTSSSEAKAWGAGLNWYLTRNVRFMLDYEETKFKGGSPTGDRENERVFFNRFQISF